MTEQLSHTRNAAATQGIPQVPGLPMLGNALSLIQDPIGFLVRSYLQFGPVFRAGAPGRWYTALAGPSANRFLLNGGERYLDNTAIYRHLAGELHNANFASTTNGERNRHVRRMLKPAFSREATSRYLPGMFATAERVARTWQPEQRHAPQHRGIREAVCKHRIDLRCDYS